MVVYVTVKTLLMTLLMNKFASIVIDDLKFGCNPCQFSKKIKACDFLHPENSVMTEYNYNIVNP